MIQWPQIKNLADHKTILGGLSCSLIKGPVKKLTNFKKKLKYFTLHKLILARKYSALGLDYLFFVRLTFTLSQENSALIIYIHPFLSLYIKASTINSQSTHLYSYSTMLLHKEVNTFLCSSYTLNIYSTGLFCAFYFLLPLKSKPPVLNFWPQRDEYYRGKNSSHRVRVSRFQCNI